MPYRVVTFTVPFPQNNTVNLFGDYDKLELRCYGDTEQTLVLLKEWTLISSPGRVCEEGMRQKVLPGHLNGVLEAVFLHGATRNDLPTIDQLPPLDFCSPIA